jgi:two-component system, chemotaxis family, protein-glutamate methylesterase/glutaminase
VLVVDDSAFARKVVREVLTGAAGIEVVAIARDGLDALEKIAETKPDVITLDLNMPGLDGIGVLKALATLPYRPTVVVVSMSDEDSDLGVQALAEGAFDVVHKPTSLATDRLYDLSDELRAKVTAAGRRARESTQRPVPAPPLSRRAKPSPGGATILVIGASTGGPQAVSSLLRALPRDFRVPIAVVLHMPEGYTEAFARRLDRDVNLDVLEARDDLLLRPGLAVIARAGMHLTVRGPVARGYTAVLNTSPSTTSHRPSVDVLFRSVALAAGPGTIAVTLTGMGNDGLEGSRAVRDAGGVVLTEAESSAVVYGMPRAVFEAGLAHAEASIDDMPQLIAQYV